MAKVTYTTLKKYGEKIGETDFYDGSIYLNTFEFYVYDGRVFNHQIHPNLNRYTGKNHLIVALGDIDDVLKYSDMDVMMDTYMDEKCLGNLKSHSQKQAI